MVILTQYCVYKFPYLAFIKIVAEYLFQPVICIMLINKILFKGGVMFHLIISEGAYYYHEISINAIGKFPQEEHTGIIGALQIIDLNDQGPFKFRDKLKKPADDHVESLCFTIRIQLHNIGTITQKITHERIKVQYDPAKVTHFSFQLRTYTLPLAVISFTENIHITIQYIIEYAIGYSRQCRITFC